MIRCLCGGQLAGELGSVRTPGGFCLLNCGCLSCLRWILRGETQGEHLRNLILTVFVLRDQGSRFFVEALLQERSNRQSTKVMEALTKDPQRNLASLTTSFTKLPGGWHRMAVLAGRRERTNCGKCQHSAPPLDVGLLDPASSQELHQL